jgi:hypothetical protein
MKRRFNNLIKFYLPTIHNFERNSFSKKDPFLETKNFDFGSVIEGVPKCFFKVSYEDAFFCFVFKFIRMKFLHINIASPNF